MFAENAAQDKGLENVEKVLKALAEHGTVGGTISRQTCPKANTKFLVPFKAISSAITQTATSKDTEVVFESTYDNRFWQSYS